MSEDAEVIKVSEKNAPSSLDAVAGEAAKTIQFKLLFFVLIIFLFLSSNVYLERILSKMDGATELGKTTTFGTIITGIMLVIFVALSDLLIKKGIV